MSGDQKPPNSSLLDQGNSQPSDLGSQNLSQVSDDTFNMLWQQIAGMTENGNLVNACGGPITWNFEGGEEQGNLVEHNVDVELQHIELAPLQYGEPNNLMQTQSFQPAMLSDNAAPVPPMSDYSTDAAITPPPTSAASQALPSNVDYSGDYNFEIYLGQPTSTAAKSVSWTYSPTLKKLFVDKDKPCPIMFKTSTEPPPGTYIRALPVFKKPEYVQEAVRRCPNHAGLQTDPSAYHLITCSDPSAKYEEDNTTGRMSVSMAYNMPQVGTEHSTYLLTFKCFLSCVGGLNRRQIQTVFTLENSGHVLGRQVIDVRVCACPGRDRKGEEKNHTDKQTKKPMKRGQSKMTQQFGVTQIGGKRKKPDDDVYWIMVKGRANYDLLMHIKESLELMNYVSQEQRNQHRADQHRLQQQLSNLPNMPRFSSFSSNSSQGPSAQPPSSQPPVLPDNGVVGGPMAAPAPPQRHDTLPLHTFAHQQNAPTAAQNSGPIPVAVGRAHDLCDGPSASVHPSSSESLRPGKFAPEDGVLSSQEISSSQMFGGPGQGQGSPKMQRSSEDQPGSTQVGVGQMPPASQVSPVDRSIGSWLGSLGCQQYLDIFNKKGVRTIDQLDEVNLEDFAGIAMPHHHREKLWKAILQLRHQPAFSSSTPGGGSGGGGGSSLLRTGSSGSTASYGSMSGLSGMSASQVHRYQATRFTLKQTMSFKVKEEAVDEEEDGES